MVDALVREGVVVEELEAGIFGESADAVLFSGREFDVLISSDMIPEVEDEGCRVGIEDAKLGNRVMRLIADGQCLAYAAISVCILWQVLDREARLSAVLVLVNTSELP